MSFINSRADKTAWQSSTTQISPRHVFDSNKQSRVSAHKYANDYTIVAPVMTANDHSPDLIRQLVSWTETNSKNCNSVPVGVRRSFFERQVTQMYILLSVEYHGSARN